MLLVPYFLDWSGWEKGMMPQWLRVWMVERGMERDGGDRWME